MPNCAKPQKYFIKGLLFFKFLGNLLLPDHESKDAFNPPANTSSHQTIIQESLNFALAGLKRWDAIHFIDIAKNGYVFEHSAAFFPLYPLTIRFITTYVLQSDTLFLPVAVLLNFLFFNISAVLLFKLTLILFTSRNIAIFTVFSFCINPANIFFSAAYTESMYFMLTLMGLYFLYSNRFFRSLLPFSLACLCRSNGILNFGYLAYLILKGFFSAQKLTVKSFSCLIIKLILSLVAILSGFLAYQLYIYSILCIENPKHSASQELQKYAISNGYKLVANFKREDWCLKTLPLSYR